MISRILTAGILIFAATAAHAQLAASTTIHNDDTCDIAQFPAATLLVPYFEVDLTDAREVDTLVSLVNTGQRPQIVSATVWTSWGHPVFTFDTFLGSYDVHSYALYDLLAAGRTPPSSVKGPRGPRSQLENPNWAPDGFQTCQNLPQEASQSLLSDVQETLRRTPAGSPSRYATGYITFDVVSRCSDLMQTDPRYFSEILYDNVLTGDTILTRATPRQVAAMPMVHIRAMPEGGPAGQAFPLSFPFTFYDLYTPTSARKLDRRQPLPALFASRYVLARIGDSIAGTEFLIWREPQTRNPSATPTDAALMDMVETVRFDEQEHPTTVVPGCAFVCAPTIPRLPSSVRVHVDDAGVFPPDFAGTADSGGWIYFNLSNGGSTEYSAVRGPGSPREGLSQNWVQALVYTDSHTLSLPVTQLGNGCTPFTPVTAASRNGTPALGPAPDVNP